MISIAPSGSMAPSSGDLFLHDRQVEPLQDALLSSLCDTGLRSDDEPNQRGLFLESSLILLGELVSNVRTVRRSHGTGLPHNTREKGRRLSGNGLLMGHLAMSPLIFALGKVQRGRNRRRKRLPTPLLLRPLCYSRPLCYCLCYWRSSTPHLSPRATQPGSLPPITATTMAAPRSGGMT